MRISNTVLAVGLLAVAACLYVAVGGHAVDPGVAGFVGAMAVVQSSYSERMPIAVEGQIADTVTFDGDTRNCKTSAGIGFGRACGQSTADRSAVLGGTLANFVGISVKDVTLIASYAGALAGAVDKYELNQNMTVMTRGDVWVAPSVAVNAGDPVYYDPTTGVFKKSGGSGPIVGARWMTTCASGGLAILRLAGAIPPTS